MNIGRRHAGRRDKHPYMLSSFWIDQKSHFWIGKSYSQASLDHFQSIVDQAQIEEDRWQKPDSKNLWKR